LATVPLFPDGFSDWIERMFDHFRKHPLLKGIAAWCEIKGLTWDDPTDPESAASPATPRPAAPAETVTETFAVTIVEIEASTPHDHQQEPQGAD
jgi:hypothetical protein